MTHLSGINIIESTSMVEQFRFPRSKKKRIRAKWEKRPENWRPSRRAYHCQITGNVYIHPQMAAKLRQSL